MNHQKSTLSYPGAVIVTGASGGVGFQVAQRLLERGARDMVFVYLRNSDVLLELCKKFDLDSNKVLFKADLTQEKEVDALGAHISQHHSKVWALLNIAGGSTNGMHWKLSLEEFNRIMSMNLSSVFLMTKAVSPTMRNQGFGRIVNFSSVVAQNGLIGAAHYGASKAAIEGLTKATAMEMAKKNVLVNAIALGYFEYGLIQDVPEAMLKGIVDSIPVGRLGNINDLFPALQFLLDPGQSYLTGQTLHLSGGLRF